MLELENAIFNLLTNFYVPKKNLFLNVRDSVLWYPYFEPMVTCSQIQKLAKEINQ